MTDRLNVQALIIELGNGSRVEFRDMRNDRHAVVIMDDLPGRGNGVYLTPQDAVAIAHAIIEHVRDAGTRELPGT